VKNDILQKAQLTKLFFKALFRKENLLRGYAVETTQGRVTWGFILGAAAVHFIGPLTAPVLVAADALDALWVGMKKNGYYEDPSQALEASS
jgi:hypothetical protein